MAVQTDPYAHPPKHLHDKILCANWSKLHVDVRRCYHEQEDDSPTDLEDETQMNTEIVRIGWKRNVEHQADIHVAKKSKSASTSSTLGSKLHLSDSDSVPDGDLFKNIKNYACNSNSSALGENEDPAGTPKVVAHARSGRIEIDIVSAPKDCEEGHRNHSSSPAFEHGTGAMRGRQVNIPTRGRSVKRASRRHGGGYVQTATDNKIKNFATLKRSELTRAEIKLKKTLQEIVRDFFKQVTGIKTTHKKNTPAVLMPGPREQGAPQRLSDSGVALMNPRFDQDVLHPENRCIFNKVVDLSVQSINEDTPQIVTTLYDEIPVDRDLLYQFAKTTFRGYCTRYQSQTNEIKGKMERANRKEGRHRARRLEKYRNRLSAVPRFIINYHFDPKPMLHADWMSEEDSGPEGILDYRDENCQEPMREWRENMLTKLGFKGPVDEHDDIAFLEVIEPMWRTEYTTHILHELSRIHRLSLTETERRSTKYKRIKNSGRLCNEPAMTVPYPFMIDRQWLKKMEFSPVHGEYVGTWLKGWTDPASFDPLPAFEPKDILEEVVDDDDDEGYEGEDDDNDD